MITLRTITADAESERPITTFADIMLPAVPHLPTFYILEWENGQSIQVHYGDPDRNHHQVKHYHGSIVDKQQFDTVKAATDCFLSKAKAALR